MISGCGISILLNCDQTIILKIKKIVKNEFFT